ncbi:MAG: hypothetical protein V4614_13425 [Pseudomonadota bacterium]
METLTPTQWITRCSARLHERWQTVDAAQLEEVALDLWNNAKWRAMEPCEAAAAWLSPIDSGSSNMTDSH